MSSLILLLLLLILVDKLFYKELHFLLQPRVTYSCIHFQPESCLTLAYSIHFQPMVVQQLLILNNIIFRAPDEILGVPGPKKFWMP